MSAEGENILMIKAKLAMILPAIVTRLHPNRLVKALTIGPGQKKHSVKSFIRLFSFLFEMCVFKKNICNTIFMRSLRLSSTSARKEV